MRGCDRFRGTHIVQPSFQRDAQRQPVGQPFGQPVGQPFGQPVGQPFGRPDGPAQPRTFRAGADDRAQVTELLQAHYVAGRLDASELEARLERALAAVTLADLDAVLADLPPLPSSQVHREQPISAASLHADLLPCTAAGPKPFRAHALAHLLVTAMLVIIWALTTPGGYFWPVWPMLGWGIGLASHGLAARSVEHRQSIADQRRSAAASYR